jgi:hypothetical protein
MGTTPNVAVTVVFCARGTMQVPVPEHPPPFQPEKLAPVAVSVMDVPLVNEAVQVAPQLIPAGFDVTVPAPATTTERVGRLKAADTVAFALIVRLQVVAAPLAAQSPPHPLNKDVAAGVATIVNAVPEGYEG